MNFSGPTIAYARKPLLARLTLVVVFALSAVGVAAGADVTWQLGADVGTLDDKVMMDSEGGYRLFLGVGLNRNWGIELAHLDLGEPGAHPGVVDISKTGTLYSLLFIHPLNEMFAVFLRGGVLDWKVDATFSGIPADEEGSDAAWGIGANYLVSDHVMLRAQLERFHVASKINFVSIGAALCF